MTLTDTSWRPAAYLVLRDGATRGAIGATLREVGWGVVEAASGDHLLHALDAPMVAGFQWSRPELVVADAFSHGPFGVSGVSLAAELRSRGYTGPVVLLTRGAEERSRVAAIAGRHIFTAELDLGGPIVREVARHRLRRLTLSRLERPEPRA